MVSKNSPIRAGSKEKKKKGTRNGYFCKKLSDKSDKPQKWLGTGLDNVRIGLDKQHKCECAGHTPTYTLSSFKRNKDGWR